MARMKFLCDTNVVSGVTVVTACKNENDDALEWVLQRRAFTAARWTMANRVRNSISVNMYALYWCLIMAVCPTDCLNTATEDGIVLHNKDLCIGCSCTLLLVRLAHLNSLNRKHLIEGAEGEMDKCLLCWRPWNRGHGSVEERQKYGANRIAEGKLLMCVLCSTKALLAGDAEQSLWYLPSACCRTWCERCWLNRRQRPFLRCDEELVRRMHMLTMFKRLFLVVLPMLAALAMLSPLSHASGGELITKLNRALLKRNHLTCWRWFLATSKKRWEGYTTSQSAEHGVCRRSTPGQTWCILKRSGCRQPALSYLWQCAFITLMYVVIGLH